MKKGFFAFKTLCLLFLWVPFSFFFLISKAHAGGYEEPIHSPAEPFQPPGLTNEQLSAAEKKPKQPVFNLNKWGNPYWFKKNVCRENMGNVVCLNPESARKLGWKVPSANKK
jgi:hypothetical protein